MRVTIYNEYLHEVEAESVRRVYPDGIHAELRSAVLEHAGDRITATLHSESAGRPSIRTRVVFVKRDGNWKLSTQSVCEGVRTVGLPIACGG